MLDYCVFRSLRIAEIPGFKICETTLPSDPVLDVRRMIRDLVP